MSEIILAWELSSRATSRSSWWEQHQEVQRTLESYRFVLIPGAFTNQLSPSLSLWAWKTGVQIPPRHTVNAR